MNEDEKQDTREEKDRQEGQMEKIFNTDRSKDTWHLGKKERDGKTVRQKFF